MVKDDTIIDIAINIYKSWILVFVTIIIHVNKLQFQLPEQHNWCLLTYLIKTPMIDGNPRPESVQTFSSSLQYRLYYIMPLW